MRAFDWERFFLRFNIDHVDTGPNVKRGELNVRCPFCANDPSHHLGVNLETGWWSCWRGKDQGHKGKNPVRLIRELLGCSWDEAKSIAGVDSVPDISPVSELRDRLLSLERPRETSNHFRAYREPSQFRDLSQRGGQRFLRYLRDRGFKDPEKVARAYRIRWAMTGPQRYRLILPIRINKVLVGWTGRAITEAVVRYKTFPTGDESIGPRAVFNHDPCRKGGRVLVVVEGPLDALKVDWYGRRHGVRAVGLMGLSWTPGKLSLLLDLASRFDQTVIALDDGAERQALMGLSQLAILGASLAPSLPADDPGAMTPNQARVWTRDLAIA